MREVVIEIESLAPGGDAVGRQQAASPSDPSDSREPSAERQATGAGRATFVALAAPGERVRARLTREKARVAWGDLVAIERPGPARVAPVCPLFGACGGCQWQHVDVVAQRAAKRDIVQRALGIAVPPVVAAGAPFGYRDRARLTVAAGRVGFRARRSHDVVEVARCPLLSPPLERALPEARALGARLRDGTELALQASGEGVVIDVARAGPAAARQVRQRWPALQAAGVVGVSVDGKPMMGRAALDVSECAGLELLVPAGGFAQVGRAANAALVTALLEAVGPAPGAVVELCAGSGNFTRHLTRVATSVHASDGDAAAVERGRRAAPSAVWSLSRPGTASAPADVVVLDPPREGADAATMAAATQARRRVVYVSCDPQTLARDAQRLKDAGFRLSGAVALDLMPQTFHVEVVAIFDRP